jgi:hypothetical protein
MFPFEFNPPAIATEAQQKSNPVSTEQISIPLGWVAGSALTIAVTLASFVWWVGKLSAKVDTSAEMIGDFEAKLERERSEDKAHRKELKDDLRIAFRTDIAQSASDICHGFELFSLEMRQQMNQLSERLEARDATVNRLGKKVDHIGNEMIGFAQQLQNQNIAIHYRRSDNGPPSQPFNYDDD